MNVLDQAHGNMWSAYNADNIDVVSTLPTASIGYSIYSLPFANLYAYSPSEVDMGNCRSISQFMQHFSFLLPELLRVTKPGRSMDVHAMNVPSFKSRDGEIGVHDFAGEIVRACVTAGWIYTGAVTIWKNPVTAMQRTKAINLLHAQVCKDSYISGTCLPEYILTFRKSGVNAEPITHPIAAYERSMWEMATVGVIDWDSDKSFNRKRRNEDVSEFPLELWQQIASPVWGPTDNIDPGDTLQFRSVRDPEREPHICPLQLEVYWRRMLLRTNPGDVILEPFGGIGSGGYVALGGQTKRGLRLSEPRRVVLVELKPAYYAQAVKNMRAVEPGAAGEQMSLLALREDAPAAEEMF